MVAVGPGRRSLNGDVIPVSVKAGDTVLLPEFGGTIVKLDSGSECAPGPRRGLRSVACATRSCAALAIVGAAGVHCCCVAYLSPGCLLLEQWQ